MRKAVVFVLIAVLLSVTECMRVADVVGEIRNSVLIIPFVSPVVVMRMLSGMELWLDTWSINSRNIHYHRDNST